MRNELHNPDVLNCLANLSNDEVFTPPKIANQMLDTLPKELWHNKNAKFLDPFCKSGVFLREIAVRLLDGLKNEIPDLQTRVNHIMQNQIYGIGITELTALLSRRSLYCAKNTQSKHSVTNIFDNENGNIAFNNIAHTWDNNGKCKYCGVSKTILGENKRENLEAHAYQFIHNENPFEDMQFDVIIGNPPYQLSDGSGASTDAAMPIYNKFVEQAIKMKPHYLSMIIPSRWMVGGRGLNKFRDEMLLDKRIKILHDFENAKDVFVGIHLDGGVCYFLWDKDYQGKTDYTFKTYDGTIIHNKLYLKNDYFDYVIRDNRILSILDKTKKEKRFSEIVSSTRPYGIRKFLFNSPERYPNSNLSEKPFTNSVKIFGVKGIKGGAKRKTGYISRNIITNNIDTIDKYKLFFTTSYSTNAIQPPEIIIGTPNSTCTETFLLIGAFNSEKEQKNCLSFMDTKFFKALLYFGKGTMQVTKNVFKLIPLQNFDEEWTDEKLYRKYGLTEEEINFIESMVRPMK